MITLFVQELILFALAQFVGLFVAVKGKALAVGQQAPAFEFTPLEIVLVLAVLVLFVYFVRRFSQKSVIFFRVILALAIFAGSQTVFAFLFDDVLVSFAAAVFLAFTALKSKIVFLHDLAVILAIAGIGGILGLSLTPIAAIFILIILSFYDIIAVYKTKHMVRMAEEMIKSRAIFGIVLPQKARGWLEKLDNVRPGGEFLILGSGDLVMPLVLIASVVGFHGLREAIFVLLFSLLGLFLTYFLFITQKTRKPMAALPPIAVLSIIGYLLSIVL